jgi:hypothetical protein
VSHETTSWLVGAAGFELPHNPFGSSQGRSDNRRLGRAFPSYPTGSVLTTGIGVRRLANGWQVLRDRRANDVLVKRPRRPCGLDGVGALAATIAPAAAEQSAKSGSNGGSDAFRRDPISGFVDVSGIEEIGFRRIIEQIGTIVDRQTGVDG